MPDYTTLNGILNMGIDVDSSDIPIEDGSLTLLNDGTCYVDFSNNKRIKISDIKTYDTKTAFTSDTTNLRKDCLYVVLDEEALYIYKDGQKKKLYSNSEANQNAFSNIKVNSVTIAADSPTDTLELAAGDNIKLTADASGDKVTIAAEIPEVETLGVYDSTPNQIATWFGSQKVMRLGIKLNVTSTGTSGDNKTLSLSGGSGSTKTITLTKNDNGYSATIASFVSAQTSSSISIPIGKLLHWRIIIYRSTNAVEGILSTNMTDIVFDTELIDTICTSSSGASIYGFLEYISS